MQRENVTEGLSNNVRAIRRINAQRKLGKMGSFIGRDQEVITVLPLSQACRNRHERLPAASHNGLLVA